MGVSGTLHIVEIKRGKHIATTKDFLQADKYRDYVLGRFNDISDPKAITYSRVQSHLIASELHPEAKGMRKAYGNEGWVFFTTWDDLVERAKQVHLQYREILEDQAAEGRKRPVSKKRKTKESKGTKPTGKSRWKKKGAPRKKAKGKK